MGAVAISTLAGALLVAAAPASPVLDELLPFLKGMTLLFWATATWWIPMLVILGVWRHLVRRFPLRYDPPYWGAVFPLGMYSVSTYRLGQIVDIPTLMAIPRLFIWMALRTGRRSRQAHLRSISRCCMQPPRAFPSSWRARSVSTSSLHRLPTCHFVWRSRTACSDSWDSWPKWWSGCRPGSCRCSRGISRSPIRIQGTGVPPYAMPIRSLQQVIFTGWAFAVPSIAVGFALNAIPLLSAGAWTLLAGVILSAVGNWAVARPALSNIRHSSSVPLQTTRVGVSTGPGTQHPAPST